MKYITTLAMRIFVLIGLLAAQPAAASVGFQHVVISASDGQKIDVGIWYPSSAPAHLQKLGPFEQDVALSGPVKGHRLPLIVISHGNGGWLGGHYDTALALASQGFVTAALTHPGDNSEDQSKSLELWRRPPQLRALVDYMLENWAEHQVLDPTRVGAFGFSAGGFTVLVAAGGKPDLGLIAGHCAAHPDYHDCQLIPSMGFDLSRLPKVEWKGDSRIKAIVAAAPGLGFTFTRSGLRQVQVPVQLWNGADDTLVPPSYTESVARDLPVRAELHIVPNARHYDFLAPCSPTLAQAAPEICASNKGFDRSAFHKSFDRQVVRFFQRSLH